MATQSNSRNVLLSTATTRVVTNQKAVYVTAPELTFLYTSSGVLSGSPVIQITATKQNTTAPVVWTTSNPGVNLYSASTGGTVVTTDSSTANTSVVYLRGADFAAQSLNSLQVTATVTDVDVLTSSVTITKLQTGATGATGSQNHRIYIATTSSVTAPSTPANTTSGAAPAGWSLSPVTIVSPNVAQWQSDGVTPSGSTTTVWSTPYLSYFKVGKLESIVAQTGNLLIDTGGSIRSTGALYGTAPGFFLGYDTTGGVSAYKISIGDKLTYDGSTLTVGAITIDSTTGGISNIGSGSGTSVANNRDSVITAPGGGVLVGTTPVSTGALKVRLPVFFTNTMVKFTVDIYEYITGYSCSLEISGYAYAADYAWYSCTALVVGNSNVEYPVYFGHDGVRCCVWIGKSTDTWSYPQVRIKDVFLGYSSYSKAAWESNWELSFVTTSIAQGTNANQYSASITDTLPGANWSKITGSTRPADYAGTSVKLNVTGTGLALSGNGCTRTGGTLYDSQCYSTDSYTGGAVCSFATSDIATVAMVGLDTNPTIDADYLNIDYAFSLTGSSPALRIYESGILVSSYSGTYTAGDILTVAYDGQFVRYYRNGDLQRAAPAPAGLKLYFDSSINRGSLRSIQFQPFANTNLSRGNNLIDPSWWTPSVSPGSTWVSTVDTGGTNTFASRELPDASYGIVWRAVSGTTSGTSIGGGWESSSTKPTNYFTVDSSKTYMFAVFTKSVSGTGQEYWGVTPNTGIVADINTTNPTAYPYFAYGVAKTTDEWHLLVGWIYPAGTTGHSNARAGAYRCSDGTLVKAGNNFNWIAGTTQCSTRAFQYAQTPGSEQWFAWPQVYLCDGSEPSFDDLLSMATRAVANTAKTAAAAAQTAANTAQADATSALSKLTDIASDNILTPDEKPQIILDYNVIATEQSGIDNQAINYSITTEKTTYDTAVTNLTSYLSSLTVPVAWNNLTGNTTIVGTTFRAKFQDVYTSRQTLLNKIAEIAGTRATVANLSGKLSTNNLVSNSSFEIAATGADRPAGFTEYVSYISTAGWFRVTGRSGTGYAFALRATSAPTPPVGVTPWAFGLTSYNDSSIGLSGGVKGGWRAGTTYVVSFYAKKVNGSSFGAMKLNWNNAPTTTVNILNPTLTTSWQRYAFKITWGTVVEGAIGQYYISIENPAGVVAGDEIHVDDLLIVEGEFLPEWADGTGSLLNKSAADILVGPIALASKGAITVGTPEIDTNPATQAGKSGFYIGNTGIVATKNGVATVQITNSGDATFSGSVSVGGANFTNGVTGFWTGIDTVDSQAKLRLGDADKYLMWDGGLKLVGATFGYLVLSPITNVSSSLMGSSNWQTVGSRTASVNTTDSVGESGSYSYQWSVVASTGDLRISSGSGSATVTVEARGTSTVVTGTIRVVVRDILNNLVATKDVSVIANLGGSSGVYAAYNDSYVTAVNYSTKGVAATATATFNRSGTCVGSGSPTVETDTLSNTYWYLGSDATIGDNYWIKATLVSGGSINSGTVGTWQQLNTARSWGITSTYKTSTLLIEIAASAGGTVLGSGYVYLEARNDTIL